MKEMVYFLSCMLLFTLCKGPVYPDVTKCSFKIPTKEIYVRTLKYKGGRFDICFAKDSVSLDKQNEYIECKTGNYLQIILDSNIAYINSQAVIREINMKSMEVKMVSDSVFKTFFDGNKIKSPYSFISIDTNEYSIGANGCVIKRGSITGGW